LSHEASAYVKKLMRDQVTRRQKLLLMVLADYHNPARQAAYPSLKLLAEESLMDVRECRRVLNELAHLIERVPGQGRGDFTEYRFLELDKKGGHIAPFNPGGKGGQKEGQKGGQKEGQTANAIRKEPEPEPELISPTPLLRERMERERRANLQRATRRGLRDFSKHPLEEWETAAAGAGA
jgi:Helix-turn-helix domain